MAATLNVSNTVAGVHNLNVCFQSTLMDLVRVLMHTYATPGSMQHAHGVHQKAWGTSPCATFSV